MNIFGYTDRKVLVRVGLAVETIAADRIDPWRLDFLDDDPVRLQVQGNWINFRRLRDVAFAMATESETTLCVRFESDEICLRSSQQRTERKHPTDTLYLERPEPAPLSFDQYLRLYLCEHCQIRSQNSAENSFDVYAAQFIGKSVGLYSPRSSACVKIAANAVALELRGMGLSLGVPVYLGKMLAQQTVPLRLSRRINWVLKQFAPLEPVVTRIFERRREVPVQVRFPKTVTDRDFFEIARQIEGVEFSSLPGNASVLDIKAMKYRGWQFHFRRMWGSDVVDQMYRLEEPNIQRFSSETLYSIKPNQARGSKIGFFDIGCNRTRPINYGGLRYNLSANPDLKVVTEFAELGLVLRVGAQKLDENCPQVKRI